ncbi:MAG: hypothetical protein M1822_006262 [Bathelium mastoideum]|nr:MAG: hypothetical protein M1822_006262 [Bathelium mastoideum]
MTSTVSPVAPNPINQAATSASAGVSSASGPTSPLVDGPAQSSTARSYANATKKNPSPPLIASSTPNPPVAVGGTGPAAAHHAKANSISPVNGRTSIEPAVPAVGAPPAIANSSSIANGAPSGQAGGDHSRKTSVTISASGTSGQLSNGGPVGPTTRPNINFGLLPTQQSPALAHTQPFHQQNSNLGAGLPNPRITSPAHSPSPIPQPASSGGRPPSGFQASGNNLTFGALGESQDGANRPLSIPNQPPHTPGQQAAHLRRESSQSTHSDMSNRGFPSGRGRGQYNQGYGHNMAQSPAQSFRSLSGQRPPNMPPQYAGQGMPMNQFNTPQQYGRQGSPSPMPVQPHMGRGHPHMAPGPYGPYPQHLNAQQPVKSPFHLISDQQPSNDSDNSQQNGFVAQHNKQQSQQTSLSPATSAVPLSKSKGRRQSQQSPASHHFSHFFAFPSPEFSPNDVAYGQYLTYMKSQGFYGMPPYDPNFAAGIYSPYNMHQATMPFAGAPPSPRPSYNPPHAAPQGYMQPVPFQGHGMSRSNSQVSERPASVSGPPQTPAITPASQPSANHTPAPSLASPQQSQNFTKAKSKGIVIKNPNGEVIDFKDQKDQKDTKAPSPAPAVVSSTPTPPPPSRSVSSSDTQHVRSDSKSVKNGAETKTAFQEQVKQKIEAEKEAEAKKKEAEERAAKEKEEAAAKEKEEAEVKARAEQEAKEKAEAEAKAKEKEEAEAQARKEKEEAEKAAEAAKAEAAKKDKDDEIERMIAEMEAKEREEEERENQFKEKRAREAEEQKKREAEQAEENMKRAEREAEEAEEKRQKEKTSEETDEQKEEAAKLFASLKKSTLGPGATATPAQESGTATPSSEKDDAAVMPPPQQPPSSKLQNVGKPRPANLKLEMAKPVEPAQPTAGMQSLKSARFLQLQSESVTYPEGYKSPNPALNQGGKRQGMHYDKGFLMQFQEVFKEKPSVDWENRVKETLGGDGSDSARPQSARTPSMGMSRQPSNRPSLGGVGGFPGPMGAFNQPPGGRTLPPGTTSAERFRASQNMPAMNNPLGQFGRPGAGVFPMGGGPPGMTRTNSLQTMAQASGPGSPRPGGGSSRGRGGSRRDGIGKAPSKREEEQMAKSMPLTAGQDLKPLESSGGGWKPISIGKVGAAQTDLSGHMPPDVVQRKVKAALNKMTPEKFDRIADQILEISAQSKDENDGRTLRQVIALTFEKACDEAHWASMYAKFCNRMLTTMSTDIKDDTVTNKEGKPVTGGALFRKYLLNRCQEEFERGWEVNLPEKPEGQSEEAAMLSDEYYIAAAAKRKGLGLIQFIGELYKLQMLTGRIMHECVMRLLNFQGLPDESAIESLVKLLRTVGATMEGNDQTRSLVGTYFERIETVMKMEGLPSRMQFMLLDTIDLRRKGWKSKDDAKGPKTIQEIREEAQVAAQQAEFEKARQNTRGGGGGGGGGGRPAFGRGDARSASGTMPPPEDYRKNTLGVDELRRLGNRGGSSRNASQGASVTFGPSTMFGSRSNSGRKGLGPQIGGSDGSGNTSRTATPPTQKEKKEDRQESVNAFSALADMDQSEGTDDKDATSPPTTKSNPSASDDNKDDRPTDS